MNNHRSWPVDWKMVIKDAWRILWDPRPPSRWLLALLLVVPATIPYVAHYGWTDGFTPTGFIQGDQPGYMAVAREYFDNGFSLTYSNPFTSAYNSPALYFQPQTFFIGLLWALTHIDPGLLFAVFGFVAALVCARVAIALFEFRSGVATAAERLALIIFFWGGGVLVIAGLLTSPLHIFRYGGGMVYGSAFRWDPFEGWWFLNFGRSLVMPLEGYYHAIFLGTILALLRGRYRLATSLIVLLCASHPYSGSELLAVAVVWGFVEAFVFSHDRRVRNFFFGCLAIAVIHVGYYLVFLTQFPEHRALVHQWSKAWFLDLRTAALAYGPVALFALGTLARRGSIGRGDNRLLLVWAVVAFLLAKHELFTSHPIEPLHFTRGYIWSALFLLGLPSLVSVVRRFLSWHTPSGVVCVAVMSVLLLTDNAVWFTAVGRGYLIEHVRLTAEQRGVFSVLSGRECIGATVVTLDRTVASLTPVYTPLRPWTTQLSYTNEDLRHRQEVKNLLLEGRPLGELRGARLALVLDRFPEDPGDSLSVRVLRVVGGEQRELAGNSRYRVVLVENARM